MAKKGFQLTDAQVKELCATLALYVSSLPSSLPLFLPRAHVLSLYRRVQVDMYNDPFSQATVFCPEQEDEFLMAQYRPPTRPRQA